MPRLFLPLLALLGVCGDNAFDHAAFDLRDEDWSVLRLAPEEGCTFTVRV